MTYGELRTAIEYVQLSPEVLAPYFGIGSMTIRRWAKLAPTKPVPLAYERGILEGLYKLIVEGKVDAKHSSISSLLECSASLSFEAVIKSMGVSTNLIGAVSNHQETMTIALSKIGLKETHKKIVDEGTEQIKGFRKLGTEWHSRITRLLKIVRAKKLSRMDKLVAYGALFYLVTPFDLIPDHIPIVGLIDDFGVLGFAVAYYGKIKFSGLLE